MTINQHLPKQWLVHWLECIYIDACCNNYLTMYLARYDKAFDRGLISLNDDFRVMLSKELAQRDEAFVRQFFLPLAGQPITLPERFTPDRDFLKRHRQEVFIDHA